MPRTWGTWRWHSEGDVVTTGVKHQEEVGRVVAKQAREASLARIEPIRTFPEWIEPTDFLICIESFAPQHQVFPAKREYVPSKAKDFIVCFQQRPVDPTDLVVLAVSVIVTSLTSVKFVSSEEHWYTSGNRQRQ